LQKHVDSGADISVACVPMDEKSLSLVPFEFINVIMFLFSKNYEILNSCTELRTAAKVV
jgi:hypothetical protein